VNLGYTNLTSPIDGVTGIRQIDIGNIIHPTDVNGLRRAPRSARW
jgi:multidrug efflux system membrane fusion protein